MKRRTKSQKCDDYFHAFKAIQENKKVKRNTTKDGSIATHSIVPVLDLLESVVLKNCMTWLKARGILANRNNVGSGQMGESGYYSYGIKNAGDIIGLLSSGQHFEIECKRGKGGRLSIGQQKRMKNIRKNSGIYLVVHGVEELEHCFKGLI